MEIKLAQTKEIVVVAQQTILSDTVTRGAVIDDESRKIVVAFYSVGKSPTAKITLWQGADYDAIGDWNYTQVDARLKELL